MYLLYEYPPSGNSYKVHLLLHELSLPHETINVDILEGASRTPEFLAKNANGHIPVLEMEDGRTLAESNAILWFLAEGTALIPNDRWLRAKVLEWMSFEQHSLEPNIAEARFWQHILHQTPGELGDKLIEKVDKGYKVLDILELGLEGKGWLVADQITIADIALFGYTHVAHEGGFSLDEYPNIRAWIARIQGRENFIPMERT